MFNHLFFKSSALAVLGIGLLSLTSSAQAGGFFDDLEGTAPTGFTRTAGVTGSGSARFSNSGEPAFGNRSYRLALDDVDDPGYARLSYTATAGPVGALRNVTTTFQTYLDARSGILLTPYVLLGVDTNKNGVYDSGVDALVVQFSSKNSTVTTNTWLSEGIDLTSAVHVQVDRTGLMGSGDNNFMPDDTPDYLSELVGLNYDSATQWGDLNVVFVRIATGLFNGGPGEQPVVSYVDNVQVTPEPTSLAALGLGALALLRKRRRSA